MTTLRLGDETVDLSRRILIVDPTNEDFDAQLGAAGVVELGTPTVATLSQLPERFASGEAVAMTFSQGQLPELALAVVRGCRIVRTDDVEAATKVCRMIEAILDAEMLERQRLEHQRLEEE